MKLAPPKRLVFPSLLSKSLDFVVWSRKHNVTYIVWVLRRMKCFLSTMYAGQFKIGVRR